MRKRIFLIIIISVLFLFFAFSIISDKTNEVNVTDEVILGSPFTSVERCNELRESGFFAGMGQTDANSPETRNQLYENCVERASP